MCIFGIHLPSISLHVSSILHVQNQDQDFLILLISILSGIDLVHGLVAFPPESREIVDQ